MRNCNDFEGIKQRYSEFWNGTYKGRALMHLRAKKPNANIWYKGDIVALGHNTDDLTKFYTDTQTVVNRHELYTNSTAYFAEAFPSAVVNLGPGVLAAALGCEVKLMQDSVWFEHFIEEWEDDYKEFDENNIWWQRTMALTKALSENANGNYMVGVADLNSVSNAMSLMRGSEDLAVDLIADPEIVHQYREKMTDVWFYCQKKLFEITQTAQKGYTDWMGMYAPDLGVAAQCDFSTLISTDMFKEFFMQEIHRQCEEIPYPIYHLDGPDCIRHLDLLLGEEKLRAIQWQPGAGAPPCCDEQWLPMLKKIQDSGKGVYVFAKMHEVETLVKNLNPAQTFIYVTEYAENEQQAAELLSNVEKWSK